jgi:2-keto-4-pentenoate hydratase/2-oxohepta-3-ene-1,7-dioic acid hydratase in catechol pathway
LKKNGEVVQDDNTDLMLFKIPELLIAITDVIDLSPGDLILSTFPNTRPVFFWDDMRFPLLWI